MGCLECASDNLEEASEYFDRAIEIRRQAGDTATSLLASSYLWKARVYLLRKQYENSISLVAESKTLFFWTTGADAHFMA